MLKRLFDIVASSVGIIVLSPIFIGLSIAVKLGSSGPIFYRATRVGRCGKHFKLLKFRSMVVNADKIGPSVTGVSDLRITRVGRVLRQTKLDELPQLINVLRGEMSIVGPRPEDPRYVALYTDVQRQVLNVRPGITSPASVAYRNEQALLSADGWEQTYIQQILPKKLLIDLDYVHNMTFRRDFVIILKTIIALIRTRKM